VAFVAPPVPAGKKFSTEERTIAEGDERGRNALPIKKTKKSETKKENVRLLL